MSWSKKPVRTRQWAPPSFDASTFWPPPAFVYRRSSTRFSSSIANVVHTLPTHAFRPASRGTKVVRSALNAHSACSGRASGPLSYQGWNSHRSDPSMRNDGARRGQVPLSSRARPHSPSATPLHAESARSGRPARTTAVSVVAVFDSDSQAVSPLKAMLSMPPAAVASTSARAGWATGAVGWVATGGGAAGSSEPPQPASKRASAHAPATCRPDGIIVHPVRRRAARGRRADSRRGPV